MTDFQLSLAVGTGQPGGSLSDESHAATLAFAVQKRSVDSPAVAQKPVVQSASERHGEQKPPLPTQTPARGLHTLYDWG